jgi:hypothetical protein
MLAQQAASPVQTPSPTPTPLSLQILGTATTGSSIDTMPANQIRCWRVSAGQGFAATTIKVLLASAATGSLKAAVYSDDNGNVGNLLVASNELANAKAGWNALSFPQSLLISSGKKYWLAVWSNAGAMIRCEVTGGQAMRLSATYGAWPSALTNAQGPYSTEASIYAFTADPGNGPKPTPLPPK